MSRALAVVLGLALPATALAQSHSLTVVPIEGASLQLSQDETRFGAGIRLDLPREAGLTSFVRVSVPYPFVNADLLPPERGIAGELFIGYDSSRRSLAHTPIYLDHADPLSAAALDGYLKKAEVLQGTGHSANTAGLASNASSSNLLTALLAEPNRPFLRAYVTRILPADTFCKHVPRPSAGETVADKPSCDDILVAMKRSKKPLTKPIIESSTAALNSIHAEDDKAIRTLYLKGLRTWIRPDIWLCWQTDEVTCPIDPAKWWSATEKAWKKEKEAFEEASATWEVEQTQWEVAEAQAFAASIQLTQVRAELAALDDPSGAEGDALRAEIVRLQQPIAALPAAGEQLLAAQTAYTEARQRHDAGSEAYQTYSALYQDYQKVLVDPLTPRQLRTAFQRYILPKWEDRRGPFVAVGLELAGDYDAYETYIGVADPKNVPEQVQNYMVSAGVVGSLLGRNAFVAARAGVEASQRPVPSLSDLCLPGEEPDTTTCTEVIVVKDAPSAQTHGYLRLGATLVGSTLLEGELDSSAVKLMPGLDLRASLEGIGGDPTFDWSVAGLMMPVTGQTRTQFGIGFQASHSLVDTTDDTGAAVQAGALVSHAPFVFLGGALVPPWPQTPE